MGGCYCKLKKTATTLHHALSNIILGDNKFAKVNHYCVLIFQYKQVNPFSNGEKLPKFCKQYFVKEKMCKISAFWGKKKYTLHEDNLGPVLRKPIKQQICGGSRSL